MPAYLLLVALLALAPLGFAPTPAAAGEARDHIVLVGHDADDAHRRDRFEDRADRDDDDDDDDDRYGSRFDDDDDAADRDDDDDDRDRDRNRYRGYHRT